jgi:hypothetical protein
MSQVRFAMTFVHHGREHSKATVVAYRDGSVTFQHDDLTTTLTGNGNPITEQEAVEILDEVLDHFDSYEISQWSPEEE